MNQHKFLVFFAFAACSCAGTFTVAGIALRSRMRRHFKSALVAKGSVTSLERSASMSSEMVYPTIHPHFKFTDAHGVEHSVRSSVGAHPETYKVGDVVEVFYDSASPQDACIDPKAVKQIAYICIFAAILAAIVATGIFIVVWFRYA